MLFLKYLGSLAAAVFFAVYAIFFLPFVSQAAVLAGATHVEHVSFGLAYVAGAQPLPVGAEQAQFLSEHMRLQTRGSARVLAAIVHVAPAAVPGSSASPQPLPDAAMTLDLTWDTPPDSTEGAEGQICLDFPPVPGLEGAKPSLTSGDYRLAEDGLFVILAESAYRDPQRLHLGRLFLALSLGLPVALLLHAVGWYFLVLQRERRSRIAALPTQGPLGVLPRSFFPDPVAEWRAGTIVIAVFALAASLFAYGSTGVVNYAYTDFAYILVASGIPVAAAIADYTAATVLNLRVEWRGLSLARGRRRLKWEVIPWEHITEVRERRRRGRHWVELAFRGQWRTLRITDRTLVDYASLRTYVKQCWREPPDPGTG